MLERLFVYGTVAPGRLNAHLLSHIAGSWLRASIRGHIVHAGCEAEQGFAGVIVDAAGPTVEAFVLSSEDLEHEWARLDEFEGNPYQRVATQVQLDDGPVVQVYVNQLAQPGRETWSRSSVGCEYRQTPQSTHRLQQAALVILPRTLVFTNGHRYPSQGQETDSVRP